jgi:PPOX class probable F420-dependent enzyme
MAPRIDPADPPADVLTFLTERHLATITIVRPDGTPHVTPIGFSYDPTTRLARVITWTGAHKAKLLAAAPGSRVALCQVDGGRWLTLEGTATVRTDPEANAEGVRRYTDRYRAPAERADRATIEIDVDRIMGRA